MDISAEALGISAAIAGAIGSAAGYWFARKSQKKSLRLFQIREKDPQDNPVAENRAEQFLEQLSQGTLDLDDVASIDDAEVVWRMALHAAEQENLKRAQQIIKAALEHHSSDPRLLITAGVVWRRLGNEEKGREYTEQAIQAAEGRPEFREQYYLAKSNLSYQLALEKSDKDKALRAGQEAARHADEFEERDSFLINYAYALMRFASDTDELLEALDFLVNVAGRDLSDEEREEVFKYIEAGNEKLSEVRGQTDEAKDQ